MTSVGMDVFDDYCALKKFRAGVIAMGIKKRPKLLRRDPESNGWGGID